VVDVAKVGRNEPCPCGSGKKYKKCCIPLGVEAAAGGAGPTGAVAGRHEGSTGRDLKPARDPLHDMKGLDIPSLPEGVRGMSTERIVQKLRELGVDFREEVFLKDVRQFRSAVELSEHWWDVHPVTAEDHEEDFIWSAAIVLWERLAPDVVNVEMLDDMMRKGYSLTEEGQFTEGCNLWLDLWEILKGWFTPDMRSIWDAERVFNGSDFLFNWCQELERRLGEAGSMDPSFHERRLAFCREFCRLFPETDESLLIRMRVAEARSLFALARADEGDSAFEALTQEYPHLAWPVIEWGDMYHRPRMNDVVRPDLERAKRIYRMGLGRDDDEAVNRRLAKLEGEMDGSHGG